jgi:Threonine dehydrogenase and related Zn-dependent dehydrogenases
LFASRSSTKEEFGQVIEAIRCGQVDADSFITHRAPFSEGAEAFLSWVRPESAVIKAVLEL